MWKLNEHRLYCTLFQCIVSSSGHFPVACIYSKSICVCQCLVSSPESIDKGVYNWIIDISILFLPKTWFVALTFFEHTLSFNVLCSKVFKNRLVCLGSCPRASFLQHFLLWNTFINYLCYKSHIKKQALITSTIPDFTFFFFRLT